jgi:ubiquinone/menaquinone biosynthesis C-methylase UbiE
MPQAKPIESVPPADAALPRAAEPAPGIPRYLQETYRWAYLSEAWRRVLDRPSVVSAILWGNANRLMEAAIAEFAPGAHVLQSACVYGDFSPRLARRVGAGGQLEVIDVAPLQIANCRRKLSAYPQVRLRVVDASRHEGEGYDGVCCFFLLHEVPEDYKHRIVDRLLASVRPGGKVVFVDYHRPRRNHPLRPVMRLVFRRLEPYAQALWRREIASYAARAYDYAWRKETYFGGLYQKTVAVRRGQ